MKIKKTVLISIFIFCILNSYSQFNICELTQIGNRNTFGHFNSLDNTPYIIGSIKSISMKVYLSQLLYRTTEIKSNELGEVNEMVVTDLKSTPDDKGHFRYLPISETKPIHSTYDRFNNPVDIYISIENKEHRYLSYEYKFDSSGNKETSIETFYDLNSLNSNNPVYKFYNYFKNSNLIKRLGVNQNNDTNIVFNFNYNNNNNIKSFEKYEASGSNFTNKYYFKRSFDINGLITEEISESHGEKRIMRYEKNGKLREIEIHNNAGGEEILKNDGSEYFRVNVNGDKTKEKEIKIDLKGRRYRYEEGPRICADCVKYKNMFVYDNIGNSIEFQDLMSKNSYKEVFYLEYFKNNMSIPKILYQNSGYYKSKRPSSSSSDKENVRDIEREDVRKRD